MLFRRAPYRRFAAAQQAAGVLLRHRVRRERAALLRARQVRQELVGARGPGEVQRIVTAGVGLELKRSAGRSRKIVGENADRRLADDVDRALDWIRCDRKAARQRLENDEAEGVRLRREDEDVARGVIARELFSEFRACETHVRIFGFELSELRAVADD